MDSIAQNKKKNKRYLPQELRTGIYAVQLYRQTKDIGFVRRRYHISKASLMRWNKIMTAQVNRLKNKSRRPNSVHPNAYTAEEPTWIRNYHRRNPNISIQEKIQAQRSLRYTRKIGEKWQMDVKYVPRACYVRADCEKFYRYTMLEEAGRKRFIYAYKENSSNSVCDFAKRAIIWFGYAPETIRKDNGGEFTHTQKADRVHPFDVLCAKLHIKHKVLRPRIPWHNGKVE